MDKEFLKKSSKTKLNRKLGFTLVELSIVVLIVSFLIAGSLIVSKTATDSTKVKITQDRLNEIYKALTNYVARNKRLPCPALLTTVKGTSTYGDEAATPGTCTGLSSATAMSSFIYLVYGMVPFKALGLDPEMAEDAWGTKISYITARAFTTVSTQYSSTGFEGMKAMPAPDKVGDTWDMIAIQGPAGTTVVNHAMITLISHGANKYNGWNATSGVQNPTGIADENSNSVTSFDRIFIAYSTNPSFDDIVLFKTKIQIVRDAGINIMCTAYEAWDGTYNWDNPTKNNGNYGDTVISYPVSGSCRRRICGQYGVWSEKLTNTTCS